jgi:hypothetical protein
VRLRFTRPAYAGHQRQNDEDGYASSDPADQPDVTGTNVLCVSHRIMFIIQVS